MKLLDLVLAMAIYHAGRHLVRPRYQRRMRKSLTAHCIAAGAWRTKAAAVIADADPAWFTLADGLRAMERGR